MLECKNKFYRTVEALFLWEWKDSRFNTSLDWILSTPAFVPNKYYEDTQSFVKLFTAETRIPVICSTKRRPSSCYCSSQIIPTTNKPKSLYCPWFFQNYFNRRFSGNNMCTIMMKHNKNFISFFWKAPYYILLLANSPNDCHSFLFYSVWKIPFAQTKTYFRRFALCFGSGVSGEKQRFKTSYSLCADRSDAKDTWIL